MPALTRSPLVCFSNVEWGPWKQRHHHLMERFARQRPVVFVETPGMRSANLLSAGDLKRVGRRLGGVLRGGGGWRDLPPGLRVHSPLVLPFQGPGPVQRWNASLLLRALRRLLAGAPDPVLWVYLPSALILQVVEELPHRLLVYDCADALTEFRSAPERLGSSEERLLRQADLVFASSRELVRHCSQAAPGNKVHFVPNAGDVERFAREAGTAVPADLAALPRPRVGYVGAVREWFHWELVERALDRFPDTSFVLLGDRQTPRHLHRRRNLHVLGPRPYSALPAYLGGMDVGIIPFRDTPLVRCTHPVKVYEYLAAGLPVVSTPMEELQHLEEVDVVPAGEPFLTALGSRIASLPGPDEAARRRDCVAGHTWDRRFEEMAAQVDCALKAGSPEREP
jgi:glycosyltransferase involved in cell wall biosynthesis